MEKSSKGLLNRNQQNNISEQRPLNTYDISSSNEIIDISSETVQLYYYSGSTLTSDAGQIAGVSVVAKFSNKNIYNDIGSSVATNNNTSLSFTSTALTNEVSFLYSISEVYDQSSGNEKLEAITKDFNQGDYCVDYKAGVIYGKKADNSTTLTSTSYKISCKSGTVDSGSGVLAVNSVSTN